MFTSPDQKMLNTIHARRRECKAWLDCLRAGVRALSNADLVALSRYCRPHQAFHRAIWSEIRRRVLELPVSGSVTPVNRGSGPRPGP